MLVSMTGYGRAQQLGDGREIGVEIKSVNHRYFEFNARVPRGCGYLEERLKSLVYARVARGKVDVSVSIVHPEGVPAQVRISIPLARSYLNALRDMGSQLGLADDVSVTALARFGDIFNVVKTEADEEEVWAQVRVVAEEALERFVQMKTTEGEQLGRDVCARLDAIEQHVRDIEARSPSVVEQYRARLSAKLAEVLADHSVEQQRILTEAAIFAEKTAVDEETVRLLSHIEQMRGMLALDEPVGRKLDFLVQECNRETNTIGSKAQDLAIQRTVVEIKSEIEKIREQIQNLE